MYETTRLWRLELKFWWHGGRGKNSNITLFLFFISLFQILILFLVVFGDSQPFIKGRIEFLLLGKNARIHKAAARCFVPLSYVNSCILNSIGWMFILCHWHVMFWVYNYNLITTLVLMSDFWFGNSGCEVVSWGEDVRLCTEEVWGYVPRRRCEVGYWGDCRH